MSSGDNLQRRIRFDSNRFASSLAYHPRATIAANDDTVATEAPTPIEAPLEAVGASVSEESETPMGAPDGAFDVLIAGSSYVGDGVASTGATVGGRGSPETSSSSSSSGTKVAQSREQPAIRSVTFWERSAPALVMVHRKKSFASWPQGGHREVMGQRAASTTSHEVISSSLGIAASSSSVGRRVRHRLDMAQGRTSFSSWPMQSAGKKSRRPSGTRERAMPSGSCWALTAGGDESHRARRGARRDEKGGMYFSFDYSTLRADYPKIPVRPSSYRMSSFG
ncbi:unnamed protein product [Pseudo-nitzschia multistriata]|uniref:Uncharacterized protein n=1 Tax=Pseudo-nitzschia multistriata TaxID=183589 RepID=A0A448Z862_9STRA|nr:unnamed protein product [Pseudo-nitzschia multistriata]